ncbi:hypothetical protein A1507_21935 [Methylomonas koyamae]|uniref:Peptidase S1 domain-containing protein n=1 Tax=Methylomonas koyamae TaxID=702114 RepID=A0A177MWR5_9GAMM|nr:hypothetical protein [Methylomonas koyamae]OAI10146.1 hypothetical protein A1507_21935 [Methylomonas koyamae]
MGIIKSVNEIVREKMNECVDVGTQQFANSIKPIYGSTEQGRPEHIGTCILLTINAKNYLLTAAHVIDNNEYTSLYIGSESNLILIEGNFLCTSKPNGCRDNDHYDFAWLEISETLLNKIGDASYISDENIAKKQEKTEGKLYLALGYPNSKNKKINNIAKSVKPQLFRYSSTIKQSQELCNKLGISGDDHLFLQHNSKHSKDSDGITVNSIEPRGISGGALIDMGNISKPEQYTEHVQCTGKLAGLLIENNKEYRLMSAVKINFIIQHIMQNSNGA